MPGTDGKKKVGANLRNFIISTLHRGPRTLSYEVCFSKMHPYLFSPTIYHEATQIPRRSNGTHTHVHMHTCKHTYQK